MAEFDTSDLRNFADELRAAPAAVTAKVRGSLTRHANKVAATWRETAPRDRPWLATPEGIYVRTGEKGFTRVIESPADPDGKPVALMVERGTSKMAPRPIARAALDQHAPELESDIERILGDAL